MSILSDKIKNLRNYKVYDYTLFDDQNKITVESYISRAAKKGEIIKIGKGKFYKRASNINNHNIGHLYIKVPKATSDLKVA